MSDSPLVLVSGATGYVGGRLAPLLVERGLRVRVLVRDRARIEGRSWANAVDVVVGDALDEETLNRALHGVRTAYFLMHSALGGTDQANRNLQLAVAFATAALRNGVERIIHLAPLGDAAADRSGWIASHRQAADVLRASGIPVTELRTAPILGCGSAFFEMIRHSAERIPILFCPRWVYTPVQPVAIMDLLQYLAEAATLPAGVRSTIEIAGPMVTSFGAMMREYARLRRLHRRLVPLPWFLPRISSHWVHWSTPIPVALARVRIEGLRTPLTADVAPADSLFGPRPMMDPPATLRFAIRHMIRGDVETAWSDALASSQGDAPPPRLVFREGLILEHRQRFIAASPETVFRLILSLGGANGWLYMNWAWRLRAWMDRFAGGVGDQRSRRDPDDARVGDVIDFWRVEHLDPGRALRLRAEMRMFGLGWLEFLTLPAEDGRTRLLLTAYYIPSGFGGWVYWYALLPFHAVIFSGLVNALAARAERLRDQPARVSGK